MLSSSLGLRETHGVATLGTVPGGLPLPSPPALRPAGQLLRPALIIAFISYAVSDNLGMSGILSLFFCGITMRHYTWHNLSPAAQGVSIALPSGQKAPLPQGMQSSSPFNTASVASVRVPAGHRRGQLGGS